MAVICSEYTTGRLTVGADMGTMKKSILSGGRYGTCETMVPQMES